MVVPLEEPQVPAIGVTASGALHDARRPPFVLVHVQFQGPVPDTVDAVPIAQRLRVGVEVLAIPLDVPQDALVPGVVGMVGAVQDAVAPPLLPAHVHVQGPEPETVEDVPEEQSPVVGVEDTGVALDTPQDPEIATGTGVVDPPPPPVEGGVGVGTGVGVVPPPVVGHVKVQSLPVLPTLVPLVQRNTSMVQTVGVGTGVEGVVVVVQDSFLIEARVRAPTLPVGEIPVFLW
jgi:hypothetical protein